MDSWVESSIAASSIFLVLAWVSFLLRCWVRGHLVNRLGWDDLAMLVSVILFTIMGSVMIALTYYLKRAALGHAEDPNRSVNMALTIGVFYIATLLCVKVSISISFLHFVTNRLQRNIVYAVVIISTLDNLIHFFIIVFLCGPPSRFWDHWTHDKCASRQFQFVMMYEQCIMEILMNGLLTLLASYIVWAAHRRQKLQCKSMWAIIFVLSIGWLSIIAPMIRLVDMGPIGSYHVTSSHPNAMSTWVTVETGCLVMAGCLMTWGPLFQHGTIHDNTATGKSVKRLRNRHGLCKPKLERVPTSQLPTATLVDEGTNLPEGSPVKKQNLVSYQKAAQSYGWNARAWEDDDDPRRRARTRTTCVGGPNVKRDVALRRPPPILKHDSHRHSKQRTESFDFGAPPPSGHTRYASENETLSDVAMTSTGRNGLDEVQIRIKHPSESARLPRLWIDGEEEKDDEEVAAFFQDHAASGGTRAPREGDARSSTSSARFSLDDTNPVDGQSRDERRYTFFSDAISETGADQV